MAAISLYDQRGQFLKKVKVYADRPDIILHEDRFFIFDPGHVQYREGFLVIADNLDEGVGFCRITEVGRKDKCLRCATDIDPDSGIRYCVAHQIGICADHQQVDCTTCGYNKKV